MSMHKVPLTPTEEAGLHAHGLQRNIGKPSQLADVFRQGVAWGIAAERERWRTSLESAWIAGYYDAGYTHDSAYAEKQAEKCAGELMATSEPAAGSEA